MRENYITERFVKKSVIAKNRAGRKSAEMRLSPEMLQAQALALGLSPRALEEDIRQGETPSRMAQAKGMTLEQFYQRVAEHLRTLIQTGAIRREKVSFYNQIIQKMNRPVNLVIS